MPYLVTAHDPDGMPRAWGQAPTEEAARTRCIEELAVYRTAKAAVDDTYLATAEYTFETNWTDQPADAAQEP